MTRDEILAMTPDQLREEIARRKGYELRVCEYDGVGNIFEAEWAFSRSRLAQKRDLLPHRDAAGFFLWPCANEHDTWFPCGDWTHDIGAADELVNEMVNAPGVVNVQTESKIYGQYSECYFREYPSSDADLITGHGETRPLAISRAWLMWDEGRKSRL